MLEEPVARGKAERLVGEGFAVLEFLGGAARMDAPEKAADPLEHLGIVELGRAPAATRIDGYGKLRIRGLQERRSAESERRDHRDLVLRKLAGELVLLADLGVAPAFRAVELGYERRVVLHPHLVDTVFVAVEREQ